MLATFNRNKLREFRAWFQETPVEVVPLFEFAGVSAPLEAGLTLLDNARLKAQAAHEHTGLPSIADDTGLEIDALGGRPGARSARYSGPGATDRSNLEAVLEQMSKFGPDARSARFRTVMVACLRGGEVVAEGVLEGRIVPVPRGEGGFGYDPIFEVPELERTLAELTVAEKNQISHRARAAKSLLEQLGLG